jgi:inhibitor of cysteine peptidase
MKKGWMGLGAALVLSLALIAAVSAQPGSDRPEKGKPQGAMSVFTDPDKPIEVAAGDAFRIVLESNPSTGYRWQLAEGQDETVVKQVHHRYRRPIVRRPGAPGHEFWRFQALKAGSAEIRMLYIRPWEKGAEPARTAVFKVTVK